MTYKAQLKIGKRIEKEHLPYFHRIKKDFTKTGKCPTDKQFAEGIAMAHISEKKDYYTRLNRAGL